MATLAAVNQVGESIVALLKARRDLLAAANQLNSLPANFPIEHVPTGKLAATPPTAGLSLTCYHLGSSEHLRPHPAARNPGQAAALSLELRYLVAAWSATSAEELSMLSWAMLEVTRHPVLDRSVLRDAAVWARDEIVQVLPDAQPPEAVFRIWDSLQQKYRVSFTFVARVVRVTFGEAQQWPPVVATRLGFADADPLAEAPV